MKILYISAEHVSGTLSLFKAEHERRGDVCRFVTFWHSRWDFPDDICLNLPLMPDRSWVRALREPARWGGHSRKVNSPDDGIPYWEPGLLGRALFNLRDRILWPRIERAIQTNHLENVDIVHLDGGLDFTRDARFAQSLKSRGGHVAAFYHGTDLRNRGVVRAADECIDLRLTSEWDLLEFDPRLKYLYLPFITDTYPRRDYRFHTPIRICHASRNNFKGTEHIEQAVKELSGKYPLEWVFFRNVPHAEALRLKQESDIFVDQLTNAGGWGYGMSSVEALSMGLPVITNIPGKMAAALGDHPFVQADPQNIGSVLEMLITQESLCHDLSAKGRDWVRSRHDVCAVGDQLYSYYGSCGWLKSR